MLCLAHFVVTVYSHVHTAHGHNPEYNDRKIVRVCTAINILGNTVNIEATLRLKTTEREEANITRRVIPDSMRTFSKLKEAKRKHRGLKEETGGC
jgi:hypothetical protein